MSIDVNDNDHNLKCGMHHALTQKKRVKNYEHMRSKLSSALFNIHPTSHLTIKHNLVSFAFLFGLSFNAGWWKNSNKIRLGFDKNPMKKKGGQ